MSYLERNENCFLPCPTWKVLEDSLQTSFRLGFGFRDKPFHYIFWRGRWIQFNHNFLQCRCLCKQFFYGSMFQQTIFFLSANNLFGLFCFWKQSLPPPPATTPAKKNNGNQVRSHEPAIQYLFISDFVTDT